MHVKKQVIQARVPQVKDRVVEVGRFIRRRKRMTIVVIAAALLMVSLLTTGDGEVFVLNAIGLGFGALLLRRFARPRGRKQKGWAQQAIRERQIAKVQQRRRIR